MPTQDTKKDQTISFKITPADLRFLRCQLLEKDVLVSCLRVLHAAQEGYEMSHIIEKLHAQTGDFLNAVKVWRENL